MHEIPPKPKRTRKAVEKRSTSAPNLDALKKKTSYNATSALDTQVQVETVDQGQRVSMTSLEDLKKFDTTKNLNSREKADLNQVKPFINVKSSALQKKNDLWPTFEKIFYVFVGSSHFTVTS